MTSEPVRAAWIMSRFPRLTETFVLNEIMAVEEFGVTVDVYPLLRERARVVHPEAATIVARARYFPFVSGRIIASQLYWLLRAPSRYLSALWSVLQGTWGSANFFFGGLAIFPKVAHAARLMARDGVQHVHCHFANHPALAGFVVDRLTGIPFSFTGHASDIYVDRHMLGRKVASAAFVVAISEHGRAIIREESDATDHGKIELLHCGADTRYFTVRTRTPTDTALSILCVARLSPHKGQRYLIEACRLLEARGVPFRCVFAGDGADRPRLQRLISAGRLEGSVELIGWQPRDEVARLMAASDVVVAPGVRRGGREEGIPVTLMEAMATGLPVIASNVGGVHELVSDGCAGYVVPPGDAEGLAEALERLHRSPELRERLGEAGRKRVLEDFDLRTNAARLVELIRSVAAPAL